MLRSDAKPKSQKGTNKNNQRHGPIARAGMSEKLKNFEDRNGSRTKLKKESDIHLLFSGKANDKNSCPGLYNLVTYCVVSHSSYILM